MILVHFQGKPFNTTIIQAYVPTTNTEKAQVEWIYDDLHDLLELTPNKWCHFHHRGLECKSRKSREACSNRQVWPWSIKWSRAKANRILPRECAGHSKHPLPPTQHKRWLYTWTSSDDQYEIWLIIFFSAEDWEVLYRQQKKKKTRSCLWLRSLTPYCKIQT